MHAVHTIYLYADTVTTDLPDLGWGQNVGHAQSNNVGHTYLGPLFQQRKFLLHTSAKSYISGQYDNNVNFCLDGWPTLAWHGQLSLGSRYTVSIRFKCCC